MAGWLRVDFSSQFGKSGQDQTCPITGQSKAPSSHSERAAPQGPREEQSMKSKQIYSSSRRRNLKGPEIQFYKTNCFLNHPFDSVVDKGNNSKKLSTGVDVVRL